MKDISRVLVLAPHTDDGEFGCGGTIAKFTEEGKEVYYAAFSTASKSVPKKFPKNILEFEVRKATEILGIPIIFARTFWKRWLNLKRILIRT